MTSQQAIIDYINKFVAITGAGKLSFDEIYAKRKKHNNGGLRGTKAKAS